MDMSLRPNRLEIFALVAVGITTVLFIGAALNAANLYASVRTMSTGEQAAGCFGWLMATFGPVTTSLVFWRWSKYLRKGWILHLLMFPVIFAVLKVGTSLMVFATGTHTDFDDTLGGPVLQAYTLFLLTIPAYYSAVIHAVLKRKFGRRNAS